MASVDLRRLWAVHLIDTALAEIRQRAARMDIGQREKAKLAELEKEDAGVGEAYRKLASEDADLSLQLKGLADKRAKFEKQLFDGSVTNVREVENYEKELAMLKRQAGVIEERQMVLMEQIPPAKAVADKLAAEMNALKETIAKKLAAARELKPALENAFKAETARRAEAAKLVPAGLLAKYDGIRARQNGVGMGQILPNSSCGACGTLQPERTIQAAKDDRPVTCESCHRLLYYTEGVI